MRALYPPLSPLQLTTLCHARSCSSVAASEMWVLSEAALGLASDGNLREHQLDTLLAAPCARHSPQRSPPCTLKPLTPNSASVTLFPCLSTLLSFTPHPGPYTLFCIP